MPCSRKFVREPITLNFLLMVFGILCLLVCLGWMLYEMHTAPDDPYADMDDLSSCEPSNDDENESV